MKLLIYISQFSHTLSEAEIVKLGDASRVRNSARGITGVLICLDETFFQILEGEKKVIDKLYDSIKRDSRHKDIVCLVNEDVGNSRLFPGQYMHTINLNINNEMFFQPIKVLLQQLTQSHRIIGRYTQPSVINKLIQGINPIVIPSERVTSAVLFSDIEGFSVISEQYPVEEVVRFINQYLDVVSNIVTESGGEVTKYIGDCVMAHFDAERADNALQAAIHIHRACTDICGKAPQDSPGANLHVGIGIDYGEVIRGNIGSSVKMDYTVLGSVVNRAQSLERMTRILPVSLVFSKAVKEHVSQSWKIIPLGKHILKGKEIPEDLYSVNDPLVMRPHLLHQ